MAVIDGSVHKGDRVTAAGTGDSYDLSEIGILSPEPHPTGHLYTGQVGYLITGVLLCITSNSISVSVWAGIRVDISADFATGMKTTKAARVGDTWHLYKRPVEALPGFKPARSMVFAGMFPGT